MGYDAWWFEPTEKPVLVRQATADILFRSVIVWGGLCLAFTLGKIEPDWSWFSKGTAITAISVQLLIVAVYAWLMLAP